jgi:hypothetical protein
MRAFLGGIGLCGIFLALHGGTRWLDYFGGDAPGKDMFSLYLAFSAAAEIWAGVFTGAVCAAFIAVLDALVRGEK